MKKIFKFKKNTNKLIRSFFLKLFPNLTSYLITKTYIFINSNKIDRKLEIGPGIDLIPQFETLSIEKRPDVNYICNAFKKMPFHDNTFSIIYASHILEHIPWYYIDSVIEEWIRILKPGGYLEIWVPDGLKICKAFVDAEENHENRIHLDGWYKFNKSRDPCVWASGRCFSYGNGDDNLASFNWHRAIFSERYLKDILRKHGLYQIEKMTNEQIRGYDHGWINLGLKGIKP